MVLNPGSSSLQQIMTMLRSHDALKRVATAKPVIPKIHAGLTLEEATALPHFMSSHLRSALRIEPSTAELALTPMGVSVRNPATARTRESRPASACGSFSILEAANASPHPGFRRIEPIIPKERRSFGCFRRRFRGIRFHGGISLGQLILLCHERIWVAVWRCVV